MIKIFQDINSKFYLFNKKFFVHFLVNVYFNNDNSYCKCRNFILNKIIKLNKT